MEDEIVLAPVVGGMGKRAGLGDSEVLDDLSLVLGTSPVTKILVASDTRRPNLPKMGPLGTC